MIHRILIISAFLFQANEQTDQRLAQLLQPNPSLGTLPGTPRPFPALKPLLPGSVPAKFQVEPSRPGVSAMKPVSPLNPAEPAPLATYAAKPILPGAIELPTTALVGLPTVDVNVPPAVPILSRPTSDRAPLSDATLEASMAAVLAKAIPLRALVVPFVPMNLPDPFELQSLIRLQDPLAEDFQPLAGPLRIAVPLPEPVKTAPK